MIKPLIIWAITKFLDLDELYDRLMLELDKLANKSETEIDDEAVAIARKIKPDVLSLITGAITK